MRNWLAAGLILATAVVSNATNLRGEESTETLRNEVADLKREVELLKR
jgi:hypothetical protein